MQIDDYEVTDEDVQERLDALRERFGTLVGVDRPAAEGDFVSLDLVAKIGDEEIDSAKGISYQVGAGNMIEGLDEALTGLSAGEETTFEAPLAGGEHAGETAQITVTAVSVKERELPEADDEFAELASEFETIDELQDDLRAQASAGQEVPGRASAPATRCSRPCSPRSTCPCPRSWSRPRCTRTSRARTGSRTTSTAPRSPTEVTTAPAHPVRARHHRRQGGGAVTQGELIEYLVAQAPRYGMDAERLRPGRRRGRPGARDGRRGRPPQGPGRRARAGDHHRRRTASRSTSTTWCPRAPAPTRPTTTRADDHEGHDHEGHGHGHGHTHDEAEGQDEGAGRRRVHRGSPPVRSSSTTSPEDK